MATAIQRRRGNTAQHASFTGLAGEITIDTQKNTVVVHDGTTAGGFPLAKDADVAALGGADITAVVAGNGLTGGAVSGSANINIGEGAGITVNADNVAVNTSYYDVTSGGTGWTGNLEPSANNTYSLGSATRVWKDIYVGPNSLVIDGVELGISNGVLQFGGANVAVAGSASSNTDTRALFSATDAGGDGSFSYSNGVFTYTGPSQAEANTRIDARISGGTGVTYTSGVIAIGQAVGTGSDVTFNDMTVSGNLTVSGTTTTVNTETINLADNVILLNSNEAGTPSQDAGIEIERGTSANKTLIWNETTDKWTVGSETFVAGTLEGALTGNVTGTVSTLSNHDTADLAEGTNLYFTAARARGNISVTDAGGDGSLSYDSGTGVITYTGPSQAEANTRIDARISGGSGLTYTSGVLAVGTGTGITVNADDVAVNATYITSLFSATDSGGDGSFSYSNGVFTYTGPSQAEANTRIDARVTGGTGITYTSGVIATTITQYTDALAKAAISVTDAGGDGSLTYSSATGVITYTGPSAAEVRAHFSAGTGVAISSGQISIGQAVGTTSNVSFNNVTATGNFFGNVTGNVTGNAGTATTLTTTRTISLTGDVTGSASFNGSANATITATIAADSVALGTDTTGNYVASVANGSYITGGSAGSEGATLTLAVDATTTATASKVAARDASGDLYAVIFQGTATSARYADLAERYEADAILEPGTVVCFGGEKEITACDHENDHAVAGVVSTDPAYMMNSAAGNNDTHPYIALTGRVPVKVVGPVAKGDLLVASEVKGHAMANNGAKAGTIIGKAISSSDNGESVVEALINLM